MSGKLSTVLALIAVALLFGVQPTPVGADDSPSGRPFEYLQAQVDELIGQTGSLAERLDAAEGALADVEALLTRLEAAEGALADLQAQVAGHEEAIGAMDSELEDLQTLVADLQGQVAANEGAIGMLEALQAALEAEIDTIQARLAHTGTMVAPGLYHVHSRVLWDIGWLKNDSLLENGFFTYNEYPRALVYANDRTTFLGPFGYYVPAVQPGATRKARLRVDYGHQWMCDGDPTVVIGDVEFMLPMIGGYYGDMATAWSNFRQESEYAHVGHAGISVYLKNFVWAGPHCGPYPGADRPKGVVYRVEIHFYDEFAP